MAYEPDSVLFYDDTSRNADLLSRGINRAVELELVAD